ncbi:uncharacterized protein LOC128222913 isoform X2 [Mya arenaria]|uniref:uncharacterized protein LOC128222913 isoform X2 n=1 Tax=Mya arenaria TaxID=6604 RepID=UPI0022E9809F|nr:uncharacterized protein LOC128222913 isoform X2 [Mya arenaria]
MAAYRTFANPESQNWLKQWRAVFITRKVILPSVKTKSSHLHTDILQKASNEQTCPLDHGRISDRQQIPCRYHEKLRNEIKAIHKRKKPSWGNASTDKWRDSFPIAKLFMQSAGYDDKSSFDEIDFNGLAAFMYNCGKYTHTVETLSDETRKFVNKIRHMPDLCSKALTDQATTECIDSMLALLNDPDFQGDPEILEAINQLDELKTKSIDPNSELLKYIIEDTTIRGVQEITELASAKEGKYSDRASEIKGDIEKLSVMLMSSIEEQGASVINDIKKTSERAKHEMSEFIGCEQQKLMNERGEQREAKLTKAKSDLHQQLLNYYQTKSLTMNVRLNIDAAVEDIYEKPTLILKNRKDKDGKVKDKEISEINDMFLNENGTVAKTVFVVGEPGKGKSSLCKKFVHGWCELHKDGNEKTKTDNILSQFGFLFYIRLREAADQCKIKDMILLCLIERIHSDDPMSRELLTEILKSECCLLLLDGLDEWTHCSKCTNDERIPHVETSWVNCTTLITTRPYKLAELKVNLSQLGNHVQLEGIQSPEELVRRVLEEFEKYQEKKRPNTCVEELKVKGLWHFSGVPIVLVQIVWLWYRDKLKANMSLTEVYEKIIEERWSEMNDKHNIEENDIPEEFLDSLSKLAFNKLFSANEDDSIVFGIAKDQLEKKYQRLSLESGIMSCSSKLGERFASYQFLHKTLQEYLSALYLTKSSRSDLIKHCQHIQEVYRHNRREGVLSMRQMFLFICGMNTTAAEMFSKSLNELFTYCIERTGFSKYEAMYFQDMIQQGYKEAEKNEHTGVEIHLQHVVLENRPYKHKSLLENCLDKRKPTLVSLYIEEESDLSSLLQDKNDSRVLDLEICNNLKVVALNNVPYEDINKLNWNGLIECKIRLCCRGPANKLVTSILSSDVTCLKTLKIEWIGWEPKAQEIFSKLQHIEDLDVTWYNTLPNDSNFELDIRHLEQLNQLSLNGLAFSDVFIPHMLNFQKLEVVFSTQQRAPRLMAGLLAQSDDSLSPNLDGPLSTLTNVKLGNMIISEGTFRRLISIVIQSGHSVNCELKGCTIEPEEDVRQLQVEMENQAALQMVVLQPVSADYTTHIAIRKTTMSAGEFRRLVSIVIQSGHSVNCELWGCILVPDEDVRQLQVEMENQSALQMVALQPVSADYTTHITIGETTMSAGEFRRLVSIVIQSGHSVNCELWHCTIEPEEDVRQLQVEMENQSALQMVVLQPVSADYTTHIAIRESTMSAGEFRRLVSIVIQSGHSVNCELGRCTIEPEEDVRQLQVEMENQSALQMVVLQPVSADYTTHITIEETTMSAGEFRRLVSIVIQSGHSVNCELWHCTIEPEEDVRQLQVEMENQSALQMVALQPVSADYTTHIAIRESTMSAGEFRRLVSIVIQSGHSVNCELGRCTIEPEEDVRQLQVEMENQSALPMVALQPVSADYTTHIAIRETTMSAGEFRRLVSIVIQSGHSVNCELEGLTIEPEEDVRQLQVEMENQSALQMVALQPVSADYTTHIAIRETTMSAGEFRRLVSIVIQSGHSVNCKLFDCEIEPEEDVRQLQVEIENQSALPMVVLQPVSADYTTHITIEYTTMSAGEFRRLVSIVIQSGHSVNCELGRCTIEPEEDVRQLQVEMENQSALPMVALQPVSADYTTHIAIRETTMSAGEFRRLVSIVIQSGHSVNCKLFDCEIEPEEDVRQLQVEIENQSALPMVVLQPVSADYTTHITIEYTTMSAGEFRRLVSIVIQSGHSVNCELENCEIEPEEDVRQLQVEMENQSALQMVVLQPVSADYTTHITIEETTISAGEFRRLVSIVIQSGHSVNCELEGCTIKPEEDVRQLQVEMENQSALPMVVLQPVSADYTTHIAIRESTMSAGEFRRLVSIVIQSGHSVNCELGRCTIEPEEDVRQLQVEMENQSALPMVALQPVSADYTTHIAIRETTMSAGEFRRLVSIVIQSGHSVNCELEGCTIEPKEDVRQLLVEMENQSAVKLVRPFQVDEFHDWSVEFNVNVNESTEPEESLLSFGSNSPCSDASKEPELSVRAFRNNSHFSVASTEPEESLQATGSRSPCSVASAEPEVPLQASGRSSPCSAASTEPEQSLQASGSNTLTPSAPKKAKMTP